MGWKLTTFTKEEVPSSREKGTLTTWVQRETTQGSFHYLSMSHAQYPCSVHIGQMTGTLSTGTRIGDFIPPATRPISNIWKVRVGSFSIILRSWFPQEQRHNLQELREPVNFPRPKDVSFPKFHSSFPFLFFLFFFF